MQDDNAAKLNSGTEETIMDFRISLIDDNGNFIGQSLVPIMDLFGIKEKYIREVGSCSVWKYARFSLLNTP